MLRIATLAFSALFAAGAVHAQALDRRLKKIADSKTIRVAHRTDATPFSFTDDKNQPAGFSIDLCKRVVNSIERQLKIQGCAADADGRLPHHFQSPATSAARLI